MVIRKGIKGTAKITGKAVKGTAKLTGKAVKGTTKLGLSAVRGENPLKRQEAPDLANENFNQEVVGESKYWDELNNIVGRKRDVGGSYWRGEMFISHDKRNKFDRYAVRVQAREISYVTVGYLPADETNKGLIEFLDGERLAVPAKIEGGKAGGSDQNKEDLYLEVYLETGEDEYLAKAEQVAEKDKGRSYYGVYLQMTSETLNGYEWEPTK